MRVFIITTILLVGCVSTNNVQLSIGDSSGVYLLKSDIKYQALSDDKNYLSLELHNDGTYILYKAALTFTPEIEQCSYASKGKWSVLAENVLEVTSENYYSQQQGFEYDLKKERKFSQDSLYIQVVFPNNFHPVKLSLTFNHNISKSVIANETYIVLPKSKYLWDRNTGTNHINFSLNVFVSGVVQYRGRILYKIFDEDIETEKFNFLTITLPFFDRCFVEFEPYYKELILVKNKNQIYWKGEIWEKTPK